MHFEGSVLIQDKLQGHPNLALPVGLCWEAGAPLCILLPVPPLLLVLIYQSSLQDRLHAGRRLSGVCFPGGLACDAGRWHHHVAADSEVT